MSGLTDVLHYRTQSNRRLNYTLLIMYNCIGLDPFLGGPELGRGVDDCRLELHRLSALLGDFTAFPDAIQDSDVLLAFTVRLVFD